MHRDIIQVKKMMETLLKSGNHIHWIGGYVYGRTASDDPFVILYPSADHLQEKAVRVYEHDFKKLPPFIPTDDVPGDTDANPNKAEAREAGIYHECSRFKIVTYSGRETPLGQEKRFGAVLCVPLAQAVPAAGSDGSENGSGAKTPATWPETDESREDVHDHWRRQAATAEKPAAFDTAMVRLEPWFEDSTTAAQFRATLFGEWEEGRAAAYLAGMEAYAAWRRRLNRTASVRQAHKAAKVKALDAYWRELDEAEG